MASLALVTVSACFSDGSLLTSSRLNKKSSFSFCSFPAKEERWRKARIFGAARVVRAAVADQAPPVAKEAKNGPATLSVEEESQSSKAMGLSQGRQYQKVSVKDYLEQAPAFLKNDGGPPRWFCPVECHNPPADAPVLFFLPGMDGLGLGLIVHHQTLAELFEVRCLHIPTMDRTDFEGLLQYVEQSINLEYAASPGKPIYVIGESFGGCLALAVAARNPTIDMVLILCNPATSFPKSQFQPLFPLMEAIPAEFHGTLPYLLSFILGDPVRMAMANVTDNLNPLESTEELSNSLAELLLQLSTLADIIPKDTLTWKLKLLQKGSLYANSRLHAVKATVLLLASGKDQLLPSYEEAQRLRKEIAICRVRIFKDSGHTLLLEGGINLATIIKGAVFYRRSKIYDHALDYVALTVQEFEKVYRLDTRLFLNATSPVMFSTLENGTIIRGLDGIPEDGPVLLVGYHMLFGLEVPSLILEFIKKKNILIRGIAHPLIFDQKLEERLVDPNTMDTVRLFGPVPVSVKSLYKLLASRSHVLLYPGGVREALHRKGEQYKLVWPKNSEFVRTAARFGATIIPFGVVGEDDIFELILDYNDLQNIPFGKEWIAHLNRDVPHLRQDMTGDISDQTLHTPVVLPKVPGRFYFLFRKPIPTKGVAGGGGGVLRDREKAQAVYAQVQSEVEAALAYLLHKRSEDPFRNIIARFMYEASWAFTRQAPSFEP